ncbi:MAG: hypothetical protein HFE86_07520 [Clostridiales bacterium]|nr:hypothetical protein [Clostridiales bacterium]
MEKKNRQRFQKNKKSPVEEIIRIAPSQTDPQGSYTGKPLDPGEVPVQDSDDL